MIGENELWEIYKTCKCEAKVKELRETLILRYIELVKIIAARLYNFYASNIEYEDLVSYGVIGLIDAIERYDPAKDTKFETYSTIRIRGAIIDQIRSLDWVPRSVRQKSKLLKEAYSKLERELGREPTIDEIASQLGKTGDDVNKMLSETCSFNIISLEDELSESYKLQVRDIANATPEEALIKKELLENLKRGIKRLNDREQLVLDLYYNRELAYKEIACLLKVTESRISQIHSKAIIKLKAAF
ncbi:RNA polymerase sigma factor WhiG [Peptoclostridium acidaminophilum DSM 3953]|uniref:RNA polymerase sigma factor WhiG n=1 Tax=Peptoclostridium acidaminophilum DSM 3953 TaxID=1286171 RepID=W8TFP6_PEPAC|nr:FliA/WhiG family RNA polymerase sigma factor [Peptoclostridium acidaminophilum]AHM56633.1 RNA polymerase sigma factor WhiG [Peptoclostridium acidaminophilum DSM 3953]